jgi:hypothetical protein
VLSTDWVDHGLLPKSGMWVAISHASCKHWCALSGLAVAQITRSWGCLVSYMTPYIW